MASMMAISTATMAAATPEQVAALGNTLTPVGAEKAGNAAGTIPEWTGGLPTDAAPVSENGFVSNPFAEDKPLFVITAQNYQQYADNLAPGQIAMFERYPETFKMPVYESRRSVSMPDAVYSATRDNAANTKLVADGYGLENYKLANAFPIPANGLEVVWNHITRFRGEAFQRVVVQATPQVNGSYTIVRFNEDYVIPQGLADRKSVV